MRPLAGRDTERSSRPYRPLHVALIVAALFVRSLVVELLALGEGEGDFGFAPLEVDLERNERQPLTLAGADHLADLLAMQQKLPRPRRLVIEVARLFVRRYVQIEQNNVSILRELVGVSEAG